MDFLTVSFESVKRGVQSVVPKFRVKRSKDLMIRGKDFYAIWDEENQVWSTDQDTAVRLIDNEVRKAYSKAVTEDKVVPLYLEDASSGMIDRWHHYCQKQLPDNYVPLDQKLIFQNTEVKREYYSSKKLPYSLVEGDYSAYDELMSVLYSPEERQKIEWAIGAIVSGDSKKIQKFIVLTGDAGTGKSTVIKIICKLFEGYTAAIDAKAIGNPQQQFALEPLKDSPLVAYQDDANLTRLEDNTRLNSLVSHERMSVNAKFKSPYEAAFNCFIFLGSNGDVQITDARSGIQRRLIDVRPTGMTLPFDKYLELMEKIDFELGAIAYHCLGVYKRNKRVYDNYTPMKSLRSTNPFYNFMEENYIEYKKLANSESGISLDTIWNGYKAYCDEGGILYRFNRVQVKTEAMAYFSRFVAERHNKDGSHTRSIYYDIKPEKFGIRSSVVDSDRPKTWLNFKAQESIFDDECADCPAQYATDEEKPMTAWSRVTTKLSEIITTRLHYVRVPENHIVIDFDLKDENGNKSLDKNIEAASKWPKTYAELSKSGSGIHLHYIYDGDVSLLSRIYDEGIEVKVFSGKSSLRRKLTKCVNLAFAVISGGLPLKGGKELINYEAVKNEKAIRTIIRNCLEKKHHGATKPEVDLIFKTLDDAYASGIPYDVTDLRPTVLAFANNSTHQASNCIKLVNKMHFKSEEQSENKEPEEDVDIIFYDVEVFPNLFVVCWKKRGPDNPVVKMINPTANDIGSLLKYRLVGFNNRRYDNHILYARWIGYSEEQLYSLSQKIISGSKNAMFGEAYNLSYTDIYDFCSKKQSLKKWEIELGIHHQELGLPWDMPVPEEMWTTVADYCINDVIATEAVFEKRYEDFVAREILADLAGMTVNDTTNTLTGKIIFGNDKHPQDKFVYTNLEVLFPGYKYSYGKSTYMGEEPGEGGYVYAEPGMYGNVALLDIASMHPTSIEQLDLFGPYTKNFSDIKQARIAIKHKDYDQATKMFDGKLGKYLTNDSQAKALSYALKIAINSVYGLTSAKFDNKFKDPRNVDNIVAKRGALFMINLKHEVQKRGYCVAHIKTDSIKIPDADPEIIKFVSEYGKQYGYDFEHEATYDKMCLVNNAVYIARYASKDKCQDLYGYIPSDIYEKENEWTATGAQFQQPYVFKTLFSKENVEFEDMCETRAVNAGDLYLDMNEDLPEGEHSYHFVGKVGQFCPIKPGCGGGVLYRRKDDKDYAATNTTGYRWLESEMVKVLKKEADIDKDFYIKMIDEAIKDISEYGDFEWFVSEEPYNGELKIPIEANKEYSKQIKSFKGEEEEPLPFN